MHVQLYSMFDKLAEMFGPVFQAVNDPVAVRKIIMDPQFKALAQDYELYNIGWFDEKNGELHMAKPRLIAIPRGEQ